MELDGTRITILHITGDLRRHTCKLAKVDRGTSRATLNHFSCANRIHQLFPFAPKTVEPEIIVVVIEWCLELIDHREDVLAVMHSKRDLWGMTEVLVAINI